MKPGRVLCVSLRYSPSNRHMNRTSFYYDVLAVASIE